MEGARAGGTAGLARAVLERARRRRRRPPGREPASVPEEDSERLSAAFASIVNLMNQVTKECEVYYGFTAACRCKEHEIKHICRYHSRQEGHRELESSEEERTEASVTPSQDQSCLQCDGKTVMKLPSPLPPKTRQPSKDIYIEVSPGIYSVTATSEDMVQQTHTVDVSAGQSIDLTFFL
ncbi:A-kinase-interacting protein 1 [Calypte anna]|uniref:A-kinase-interacting protein 1 n=1 Tax=Calypte anna TaxID=9244 RepID=UPI0011C37962|nr:A-kinase-interacting protein 1 [Calypte anna]